MALSKPKDLILQLTSAYFERLYTSPLKTKAITSCVIAALGNFISQKISGAKRFNEDSFLAFALFGLFFGGPLPHYFYTYINPFVRNPLILLLIERCLYTPCYQALALYMLSMFEGSSHDDALKQMKKLYLPVLTANLKYLTLLQFINLKYVPPILRVLVVNLIGFCWAIYLAQQRSKQTKATK
ncbi:peroxisomal membrane protein 2 [Bombus vancouverensis nearcticus]|uniref:Peroxisomal membrane protein 2 n=1 Tax=Bombus impatiens TaxID=132113 RepID=A0A6P3DY61_BOMIM|nr:peroxisomal membrane protein 2 [Bombus impatiens]XP_033184966.1 peroxisomal membrane protein 2 [Bombus vancouverensis nearcticus]XP_050472394.1 peroxisomal membrane protein 2 [Bombus huntii]